MTKPLKEEASRAFADKAAGAYPELKKGDVLADGRIYAGIDPETKKPVYNCTLCRRQHS